jgi:hypothetical protein
VDGATGDLASNFPNKWREIKIKRKGREGGIEGERGRRGSKGEVEADTTKGQCVGLMYRWRGWMAGCSRWIILKY